MKAFFLCLFSFITLNSFARDTANYYITEGKLHKGGKASVEILENSETKYTVKLTYELYKKILVPIPSDELKGETVLDFPPEFRDERGYMELEAKKEIELSNATLKFIKRVKFPNTEDAYLLSVLPKNGKSKIDITYHPSVRAAGWAKVLVTFLSSAPIIRNYQVEILLGNK